MTAHFTVQFAYLARSANLPTGLCILLALISSFYFKVVSFLPEFVSDVIITFLSYCLFVT